MNYCEKRVFILNFSLSITLKQLALQKLPPKMVLLIMIALTYFNLKYDKNKIKKKKTNGEYILFLIEPVKN